MIIKTAEFKLSSPNLKGCPKSTLPEFAFIGRSNVGKSSLINLLTGRKDLAHISATPGKTRLINYFLVNNEWYLVDLPGYGYAKLSKSEREKFGKSTQEYLIKRENLYCIFVLIDSRIPPQEIDLEFINWLGSNQIPFVIVFTKTDKLKPAELSTNTENFKRSLKEWWAELPTMFLTSTVTKSGKEEILDFIEETVKKNTL